MEFFFDLGTTFLLSLKSVGGTLIATAVGAVAGAAFSTYTTRKTISENEEKFNKQFELITKESCRRVNVYLKYLIEEDFEEAISNLDARLDGIRVIERLLAEVPLKSISISQVLVVYRARETIQEIIYDLSKFNDNHLKNRQFNSDVEYKTVHSFVGEEEKKYLQNKVNFDKNNLKDDYENRLLQNMKDYFCRLELVERDYHKLGKEILELHNKK